MFENAKLNIRSNRPTGSQSAMDFIQYIKELEATNDRLTAQNKKLLRERDSARAVAKSKTDLVTKLQIGLARAAGDVNRLKEENKILRKVAKDLHARVKSWQTMAKNLFRKNRNLEIEAICKECELDEAYDRIRELEADLAAHDVTIEEIIISAEETAEDWSRATEEAESKAYRLEAELTEKDWLIKQYEEKDEAEKLWAEATSVGSIITVAKEVAAYEIEQVFIEAWPDRSIEKEIECQELNDEIICGLGYIREEATEIESLWRVERVCKEIDDILNNFSSFAE